jgi:ferric-dicitrate binding protein FerR (iron transport regulator)
VNRKNKYDLKTESGSSGKVYGAELDAMIGKLTIPSGKSKEQSWQAIFERLEEKQIAKTIPLYQIALKVAASLIILISIGGSVWIWGFSGVIIYCPKGQHITAILPDSSKIMLNADTKISYNKALWNVNRKVYITGEALFKVKKGKRFDVVAEIATTSVLGTTFDVYAREGKIKVSCIEGRVSVQNNNSDEKVILTAGLYTQATHNKITKPSNSIKNDQVAWTSGEFNFNNVPFIDVLKEIERQFNVVLIYNAKEEKFSHRFTVSINNKDLDDALRKVCLPMDMSYTTNGKTIEIKQIKK